MFRRAVGRSTLSAIAAAQRRWCIGIPVPYLADSITNGVIAEVTAKVGDAVEEDDVICKVESEKVAVEIRAPKSGVITKMPEDGAKVNVGDEIAALKEGAGGAPKAAAEAPKAAAEAPKTEAPKAAPTPAAPKVAAPQAVVAGSESRVRLERLSPMRQRIADRLKASQNTCAMLTTFNEIDMTPLMKLRSKHKDEFQKKHGVKLGLMSPFVKASASALMDVPIINAQWGEGQLQYHDFVDISIAVATKTGLVVPVLRDVQDMNFADIEKKIEDYGTRAKQNKITLPEMTGGTFTISNGGTFGSWMGTPIINPPQSAILGMHAIKKKAWVNEKDELCVRHVMAVALTYDHRLIDGRDAVTFLVKIKNLIEDPVRLVLDMP